MSNNSDSSDMGKMLGVVASVIGILAFFGITSCDELMDVISGNSANADDSAATIAEAAVGDCIQVVDNRLDLVSCENQAAEYTIAARIPYDDQAYLTWSGEPNEAGSKAHNAMAGCAMALGHPYQPLYASKTTRIFWIADATELLCTRVR